MNKITALSTATALFALTSTVALAECPTGADKKDGITLAQNTPFFMRSDFKSTPEGFVEQRVMETGGKTQSTMALYRHGLVMSGEHSPAGHVEITYVDSLAPLDQLPDKGTLSFNGIAKGAQSEAYVKLEIVFVGAETRQVGACSFEVWTVTSTLKDRGGTGASFLMAYAPELDLVLSASTIDAKGTETPVYAYQWAGKTSEIGE